MNGQWLLLCIKWEERRNVKIKKEVKKERKKVNRPITHVHELWYRLCGRSLVQVSPVAATPNC